MRGPDLPVAPEVLGLLGPNGAGKSTLMRILATVTAPIEGRVLWDGGPVDRDPDRLRRVLGYRAVPRRDDVGLDATTGLRSVRT